MIKPIETIYKGYKFRSRLEARWAVFFDSLGLSWEYEKEGFEYNGQRYLPDFYFPKYDLWIEVKPLIDGKFSDYEQLKIYLAGKIADNKWRDALLDQNNKIMGHFYNTGPFLAHRESYYENHHGNEATQEHGWTNDDEIYQNCIDQIKEADVVFAWVNTEDCYGTLFELGYAKGIGKTVLVGVDLRLCEDVVLNREFSMDAAWRTNFWFSLAGADRHVFSRSVIDAFTDLTSFYKKIDNKLDWFCKSNEILYLCGSPHEHMVYRFDYWENNGPYPFIDYFYGYFTDNSFDEIDRAILKAQQARFEYGEVG